ncbi:MAG: lipopolysaccharide assembly protein LapA domain-containing protein [Acidimicrobiales bacterium]
MSEWEPVPEDDQPARPVRDCGRDARLVLTGISVVLLVWFALANLQGVRIRFWVTAAHAPLIVVIAISGVLGALVSGLLSRAARRRRTGDKP